MPDPAAPILPTTDDGIASALAVRLAVEHTVDNTVSDDTPVRVADPLAEAVCG